MVAACRLTLDLHRVLTRSSRLARAAPPIIHRELGSPNSQSLIRVIESKYHLCLSDWKPLHLFSYSIKFLSWSLLFVTRGQAAIPNEYVQTNITSKQCKLSGVYIQRVVDVRLFSFRGWYVPFYRNGTRCHVKGYLIISYLCSKWSSALCECQQS